MEGHSRPAQHGQAAKQFRRLEQVAREATIEPVVEVLGACIVGVGRDRSGFRHLQLGIFSERIRRAQIAIRTCGADSPCWDALISRSCTHMLERTDGRKQGAPRRHARPGSWSTTQARFPSRGAASHRQMRQVQARNTPAYPGFSSGSFHRCGVRRSNRGDR